MNLRPDEAHLGYAPERETWDDDFAARALDAGGHLADDVASVLVKREFGQFHGYATAPVGLLDVLVSDDTALD